MPKSYFSQLSAWWQRRHDVDRQKLEPNPPRAWRAIVAFSALLLLIAFGLGWWVEWRLLTVLDQPLAVPIVGREPINQRELKRIAERLTEKDHRHQQLLLVRPTIIDPSR